MTNERAYEYAFTFRAVADHLAGLEPDEPVRLLDVGTAGSQLPNNLADVWVDQVVCCDPDCRGFVRMPWQNITYVEATVQDYAMTEPEPFDIVTCVSTLEHAEDVESAIAAIVDLMKPAGLLVVTVPYHPQRTRLFPDQQEFTDLRPLHAWSRMFERHELLHDQEDELYLRAWRWVNDEDGVPVTFERERCRAVDDDAQDDNIICMTWTRP